MSDSLSAYAPKFQALTDDIRELEEKVETREVPGVIQSIQDKMQAVLATFPLDSQTGEVMIEVGKILKTHRTQQYLIDAERMQLLTFLGVIERGLVEAIKARTLSDEEKTALEAKIEVLRGKIVIKFPAETRPALKKSA